MATLVIGLSSLMVVRIERRSAGQSADFSEAQGYAHSAIEMGMLMLRNDYDWRTTVSPGVWAARKPIGRGYYSLNAIDPSDNNFGNNASDHVVFIGTGEVNEARYKLSVELEPYGLPGMDFLASAVHTSTHARVDGMVTVDAPISSNGTIGIEIGAVVRGDVEAVGDIFLNGALVGTATEGISPKEVPTEAVIDYYIAQAVAIDISSIPKKSGCHEVARVVISPASNPFGAATHPQGLYLIDCKNEKICIRDSRIQGSLVLLDPGSGSEVGGAIQWAPFDPLLPALLVRGPFGFAWSGPLLEAGLPPVNFNPPGSPSGGAADVDVLDVYPGSMRGLIMISGDLLVETADDVTGVILCLGRELHVKSTLVVHHDPALIAAPPPGFERAYRAMTPIAGSWKQVVD